jgi:hypothetical protein
MMLLFSYPTIATVWCATFVRGLSVPNVRNLGSLPALEPYSDDATTLSNLTYQTFRRQELSVEWLRIMPLGASITQGVGSSPQDGYRKPLRDHLRSLGYKVNMVGSR